MQTDSNEDQNLAWPDFPSPGHPLATSTLRSSTGIPMLDFPLTPLLNPITSPRRPTVPAGFGSLETPRPEVEYPDLFSPGPPAIMESWNFNRISYMPNLPRSPIPLSTLRANAPQQVMPFSNQSQISPSQVMLRTPDTSMNQDVSMRSETSTSTDNTQVDGAAPDVDNKVQQQPRGGDQGGDGGAGEGGARL